MKRNLFIMALVWCFVTQNQYGLYAQQNHPDIEKSVKTEKKIDPEISDVSISINNADISGQWFISYREGKKSGIKESNFLLHRGYINIKKKLTDRLSGRITPDVSVDREGDGEGDLEMRLKYCYVDLKLDDMGFLTNPHIEFGLCHRPWLDYEEHINYYRMQGTMFLERNGVFNSADYGITYFAEFGGQLDDEYKKEVNSKYAGKYGSMAVGFYNGGGYHAIEKNKDKTFEGRLSIRPITNIYPGFQITYHGIHGKGNTEDCPDWTVNSIYLILEDKYYTLTYMFYDGKGNFKGNQLDNNGNSLDNTGYSFFSEIKIPEKKISLVGRYDYFKKEATNISDEMKRIIAGVAYHISGKTKALLDYDISTIDSWSDYNESIFKFTVEYHF